MGNIIVSIGIKYGICAIILVKDGVLQSKTVFEFKDETVKNSTYISIIHAFIYALKLVRQFIENNPDAGREVCFEVSNSIFVKWIDNQYSKEAYQDIFVEALNLLQELPIKYAVSYNVKPKAIVYASKEYIKKEKLSGLDLKDFDDEEN